jgi:hypothetical protein
MSTTPRPAPAPREQPGPVGRRVGYALAILINVVLLLLVNVWPTWRVLPFLTEAMLDVLPLVNLGLIAGAIVNLFNLVFDFRLIRAAGDLITSIIAVITLVRFWDVFPFAFPDSGFDWELLTRIVLGVAIGGTVIAVIVQVVLLIRILLGLTPSGREGR